MGNVNHDLPGPPIPDKVELSTVVEDYVRPMNEVLLLQNLIVQLQELTGNKLTIGLSHTMKPNL